MSHPRGQRRPEPPTDPVAAHRAGGSAVDGWVARLRPRNVPVAVVEALVVGSVAALAWALLRAVLELSVGLLAVAAVGGWAIGAIIRQVRPGPVLAAGVGAAAGLLALLLTWLVAMAVLPESSRSFGERLAATPFIDWLAPQLGLLEIVSVALFAGAAAYAARARRVERRA